MPEEEAEVVVEVAEEAMVEVEVVVEVVVDGGRGDGNDKNAYHAGRGNGGGGRGQGNNDYIDPSVWNSLTPQQRKAIVDARNGRDPGRSSHHTQSDDEKAKNQEEEQPQPKEEKKAAGLRFGRHQGRNVNANLVRADLSKLERFAMNNERENEDGVGVNINDSGTDTFCFGKGWKIVEETERTCTIHGFDKDMKIRE